ncbi:unnamed protein product [Pleuronectes platessa]|uniref:Uncharacterized protein n=1 Tax=Pleuronectes platessa TaxID=8262 RepID=A0A9N7TQM7_PLEPL|nr:unnamed protein product [Pleuronectes platessa]
MFYRSHVARFLKGSTINRLPEPSGPPSVFSRGSSVFSPGSIVSSRDSSVSSPSSSVSSRGFSVFSRGSSVSSPSSSVFSRDSSVSSPSSSVFSRGSSVFSRGFSVSSRGSTVLSPGSIVFSRGSSVFSRGSIVSSRGSTVLSPGSTVFSRGSTVCSTVFSTGSRRFSSNPPMPQKQKRVKAQQPGAEPEASGPVVRDRHGALTITVHAKPGSKHSAITDVSEEAVGVSIAAPPTDGEANTELIRFLAEVLDLKKSHISLHKGSRSRDKLVRVDSSLSVEEVLRRLRGDAGT